jgi:predicted TPR repeat methyltransferase
MLQLRGEKAHWQLAVDLGCGTGLMGPLLRSHVSVLEGVDLSTAMVEKARERGCYDRCGLVAFVASPCFDTLAEALTSTPLQFFSYT